MKISYFITHAKKSFTNACIADMMKKLFLQGQETKMKL